MGICVGGGRLIIVHRLDIRLYGYMLLLLTILCSLAN